MPNNGSRYKNQSAPENPPSADKCDTFDNGDEKAPKLTIVYSANDASGQNLGRESHWTTFEMPLPAASAGANVSNGNLILSQADFSLPSRGIPTMIARSYNSRSNRSGLFGYGWSSGLELNLSASGDGTRVDFFDADGTCHPFTRIGTSGGIVSFKSPPGMSGNLKKNSSTSTYSLGFSDGSSYFFNSSCQVTSFLDRNGNTLTWQYSGSQLTGLQDTVGRQISDQRQLHRHPRHFFHLHCLTLDHLPGHRRQELGFRLQQREALHLHRSPLPCLRHHLPQLLADPGAGSLGEELAL
ncbi:MAG: DUF6531 domain-containing protein [Coprothermobacterota bacterium]|nr:DUF6531 domain-containing protein [Coprothermobacterota bacterium]